MSALMNVGRLAAANSRVVFSEEVLYLQKLEDMGRSRTDPQFLGGVISLNPFLSALTSSPSYELW